MSSKMLGCRILQGAAIAYQTRVLRVIALELVTNFRPPDIADFGVPALSSLQGDKILHTINSDLLT
jgi:hypothetical protein